MSKRVRIARATDDTIVALVTGSTGYAVDLHAADGQILMSCTCAYAEEHGLCKHIWSVFRQAEAEGKLQPLLRVAGPRAQPYALSRAERDEDTDLDELEQLQELDLGEVPPPPPPPSPPPAPPEWRRLLESARQQMAHSTPHPQGVQASPTTTWPANRRLVYIVDLAATWNAGGIVVELATEKLRRDGSWDPPAPFRLSADVWFMAPDPIDRQIAQMLLGALPRGDSRFAGQPRTGGFVLHQTAFDTTLRLICDTGRCRLRTRVGERPVEKLSWDDGPPWRLRVRVARDPDGCYALTGVLARGSEEMSLAEPAIVHMEGILVARGLLARFDHGGAFALASMLRRTPVLALPDDDLPELLGRLYALPVLPDLDLPPDATVLESHEPPIPCLTISPDISRWRSSYSVLSLAFRYGSLRVSPSVIEPTLFDPVGRTVHHRDHDVEAAARAHILALGARDEWDYLAGGTRLLVSTAKLTTLVLTVVREGWLVDAEGIAYRAPGAVHASVRSGVDWFDLHGGVRYGDTEVALHTLLEARRRGEHSVVLDDGSVGILPMEWLAKLGTVAAGGTTVDGITRFARSQVALLDALLDTLPDVDVDETFERARTELRSFDKIAAADAPPGFVGTLREYQREGLGWLHFLRQFELGGCLADDMGLGKTIQVLALLEARRAEREAKGPSIVVVPRSLMFNWMREAARFTPQLRMLDHTGLARRVADIDLNAADVVLTTYGTLRRVAPELSAIQFDYAILDEAQAIKNAGTASAKAARLLRAHHRLAVTGTPIENRLEELWSLFEFLNPGMLGESPISRPSCAWRPSRMRRATGRSSWRAPCAR